MHFKYKIYIKEREKMKYVSTRNANTRIDSAEAIIRGLSKDGGLYMPESIPSLTETEINSLVDMDYKLRAKLVLSKFLTDYTDAELENCINGAYTGSFDNEQPAPIALLGDKANILELWHGPTCAFKDLALSTGFAVHGRAVTEEDFDITKHPGSMHHPAFGTVTEWWLK